jgi:hypothetical protein
MTDAQLRADTDMGRYAAQVLENPAFALAFEHLKAAITQRFVECPVHDVEQLQYLASQIKLVESVRVALHGLIEKGKLAASTLPVEIPSDQARQSPIVREFHRTRRRTG